jgi:hypothetical protein
VLTKDLFQRGDWLKLNPSSIVAVVHENIYYFCYSRTVAVVTGTLRQVVEGAYTDMMRIGPKAPTETEIAWWVAEAASKSWTMAVLRENMLRSAATFQNDPFYATNAAAATAMLALGRASVVTQTYSDIGRTPTTAEKNWWENEAVTNGWDNPTLRKTMLQSASTFVGDTTYGSNASVAIELLQDMATTGCYALDLSSGKLTSVDLTATAFFIDKLNDKLYAIHGNSIVDVGAGDVCRTARYRTGVTKLPKQSPLAWLQVDAEGPVTVKWTADSQLRHTVAVSDNKPVRLPPGRYLEHEVEVLSNFKVTSVTLAGTTDELQSV